ncbi:hypothetical protein GSI_04191 [Ganoderma sinense ZZ0214-1]|uniref:Uncharacterized protein n=1 Tax=Ganoderma sinense ZZ0214-1 TaxID=1077348 RepID=A0A2G8SJ36_9APHY|nr:hypothetical protein GSI_04191 [Ganoderma sinense ZZ0214-1]
MLPKHPGVVDAVSHAAATILSTKIKPRHKPTLLHVLHRRIAADLQISLALYHGELCVQSTVQLRLDFDRFPTTVGPPVVYPDHPLRQSRMSFESLLARDDASGEDAPQTDGQQGEDHPAMHHFALRIQKSVKRLSRNPHHYERDAHADLDKITRDLEQAQALNERINRWCSAVRALESAMQVRGSRSSVSTAGVDACAADVAALAEVLLADVKEVGSDIMVVFLSVGKLTVSLVQDEFRLAPEHEVYTGRLLVVRTAVSSSPSVDCVDVTLIYSPHSSSSRAAANSLVGSSPPVRSGPKGRTPSQSID